MGGRLFAAHAVGVQPNLVTAVYAQRVASWQRPDGHWPTGDARPPQSYSLFTATALAVRRMHLYMPAQLGKETLTRSARAISVAAHCRTAQHGGLHVPSLRPVLV